MRIIRLKPYLTTAQLKEKLNEQDNLRFFRYWQLLYIVSVSPGKTDVEYADMTALGKANVYRIVSLYNKKGIRFTDHLQWGGRRKERSYLSIEEEKGIMEILSKHAENKKIRDYHDIQKKVEQLLGHKVSPDFIWDLFRRHLWRKKIPPRFHHFKNTKLSFLKKTSLGYWVKPE